MMHDEECTIQEQMRGNSRHAFNGAITRRRKTCSLNSGQITALTLICESVTSGMISILTHDYCPFSFKYSVLIAWPTFQACLERWSSQRRSFPEHLFQMHHFILYKIFTFEYICSTKTIQKCSCMLFLSSFISLGKGQTVLFCYDAPSTILLSSAASFPFSRLLQTSFI